MNPEKMVMDWLNSFEPLHDYPAAFDAPRDASSSRLSRFITVERAGGEDTAYVSRPLIVVQIWATSRWEASQTAQTTVLPRLYAMWRLPQVASVQIVGTTNFPSDDGHPRYQISIQPTIKNDLIEE